MSEINSKETPLVVDLDGTLIKTDILIESINKLILHNFFNIFKILFWLIKGRLFLKNKLADNISLDFKNFPFNQNLLDWLIAEKNNGRKIYLATASHEKVAKSLVEHLNLFDDVYATDSSQNLKGIHKAELLREKFPRGFDYVGNSFADIPIFKKAKASILVTRSQRLINKVKNKTNIVKIFNPKVESTFFSFIKTLRLHQWSKNLLIFVPIFTAQMYTEVLNIYLVIVSFFIFSFVASSVYILNDLVDLSVDRKHPRKKYRPLASGELNIIIGWMIWPIIIFVSFFFSNLFLPSAFNIILLLYLVITLLYSFLLKRIYIIDTLALAFLYSIRIFSGAAVINASLSYWLLAFSFLIFLSFALLKRFVEIKSNENFSGINKISGRAYYVKDKLFVFIFGLLSGFSSVLILILYVQSPSTAMLYSSPLLIGLSCPIILLWIGRSWFIANKGNMEDDPVLFIIKDKISWFVFLSIFLIFILAM